LPRKGALVADSRVFLMKQADAEKLLRGLEYYIEAETPEPPPSPEGFSLPQPGALPG
jgi:hypothetical protein